MFFRVSVERKVRFVEFIFVTLKNNISLRSERFFIGYIESFPSLTVLF